MLCSEASLQKVTIVTRGLSSGGDDRVPAEGHHQDEECALTARGRGGSLGVPPPAKRRRNFTQAANRAAAGRRSRRRLPRVLINWSLACREHYFRFHRQRKVSATGGTILSVASNVSLVPGLRRAAGDLFLAS